MHRYVLRLDNNEFVNLAVSDEQLYACPVCGGWGTQPGWFPASGEMRDAIHGPVGPSFDTCCSCQTEYGFDDGAAPDSPPGKNQEIWHELRVKWLDRENWSESALRQLRENLGIDTEQLKRQTGRE